MTFTPPWHTLGTTDIKDKSISDILAISKGDYDVILSPVMVENPITSNTQTLDDRYVTGRIFEDGKMLNWEVVKGRYEIIKNEVLVKKAKAVVNILSEGQSYLDCAGVLEEGRKFFVTISTGQSRLKEDTVHHYIAVITSHDGSLPICYYCLDVRQKTGSVYRFQDTKEYSSSMRKRHTPHSKEDVEEASQAVEMRIGWNNHFYNITGRFSAKKVSDFGFNLVTEWMWPEEKANSLKKKANRDLTIRMVKDLYLAEHNSGIYGHTGWSLFNALNEYIDKERKVTSLEAAKQSLEIDNIVHRLKIKAYESVESLCNIGEEEEG